MQKNGYTFATMYVQQQMCIRFFASDYRTTKHQNSIQKYIYAIENNNWPTLEQRIANETQREIIPHIGY